MRRKTSKMILKYFYEYLICQFWWDENLKKNSLESRENFLVSSTWKSSFGSKLHHQLLNQLNSRSHVWWFKFPWKYTENSFLKLFMASRFELCFKFAQRLVKSRLNMDSECIINFNKSTIFHAKLVIPSLRDLFTFYIQLVDGCFQVCSERVQSFFSFLKYHRMLVRQRFVAFQ